MKTFRFPRGRRRFGGAIALAAALAAAAFGGYLAGANHGSGPKTVRVAAMTGSNALATVRVGAPDAAGNWPVDLKVRGLPKQHGSFAYYEVFVMYKGKPSYPCGGFRAQASGTTKAHFTVPYTVDRSTKWIVTAVDGTHSWPGRTVMTRMA